GSKNNGVPGFGSRCALSLLSPPSSSSSSPTQTSVFHFFLVSFFVFFSICYHYYTPRLGVRPSPFVGLFFLFFYFHFFTHTPPPSNSSTLVPSPIVLRPSASRVSI